MALTCLYTTVKCNVDGGAYFGFLPPFGVHLDEDEEYSFFGNLIDKIANRRDYQRVIPSFEESLNEEEISILSTPAVILQDAVTEDVKILALNNEALGTDDPCWPAEE
jgi:hypothetical protein